MNETLVRIEPQPEDVGRVLVVWRYDNMNFFGDKAMRDYLYNSVYLLHLANSTEIEKCRPVLLDGVWYWKGESDERTTN